MTTRTDVHRPSAIQPDEYEFVALGYQGEPDSIDECYAISYNRELLFSFMKATGAKFSNHAHGGNCHICGAWCIYDVIFHHVPTNTLIRTGMDCAEKMDMGDEKLFRDFRAAIKNARDAKAGKNKAKALLTDRGLSDAWELFELSTDDAIAAGMLYHRKWPNAGPDWLESKMYTTEAIPPYRVLEDILRKLVRFGELSEKQYEYLEKLVPQCKDWKAEQERREAKHKAEHDAAAPVPEGRQEFTGVIIKAEWRDSEWGPSLKMLFKDDRGFRLWGSVPKQIEVPHDDDGPNGKGLRITFTGTPKRSDDDEKFGFVSRPSKAEVIE